MIDNQVGLNKHQVMAKKWIQKNVRWDLMYKRNANGGLSDAQKIGWWFTKKIRQNKK
jgi:hypothetical protein